MAPVNPYCWHPLSDVQDPAHTVLADLPDWRWFVTPIATAWWLGSRYLRQCCAVLSKMQRIAGGFEWSYTAALSSAAWCELLWVLVARQCDAWIYHHPHRTEYIVLQPGGRVARVPFTYDRTARRKSQIQMYSSNDGVNNFNRQNQRSYCIVEQLYLAEPWSSIYKSLMVCLHRLEGFGGLLILWPSRHWHYIAIVPARVI